MLKHPTTVILNSCATSIWKYERKSSKYYNEYNIMSILVKSRDEIEKSILVDNLYSCTNALLCNILINRCIHIWLPLYAIVLMCRVRCVPIQAVIYYYKSVAYFKMCKTSNLLNDRNIHVIYSVRFKWGFPSAPVRCCLYR